MDAKHMLDGWKWFPALGLAGGAILAGVFAGMALAAFATGGLQDRLLQPEPQPITAFLGNPTGREPDFMAAAEDEDLRSARNGKRVPVRVDYGGDRNITETQ